jgi:hypothetical protein
MNDIQYLATLSIVMRLGTLLVGALCVFLGYRLFMRGIYCDSTDVKATWGNWSLLLKRAAPGSLFALFGVVIITASILFPSKLSFREKGVPQGKPPAHIASLFKKVADGRALTDTERAEVKLWLFQEANSSTVPRPHDELYIEFMPRKELGYPRPGERVIKFGE